ncbi:MAG TPA: sensor histidine kinase N-terminal domain-containing protein, partial [Paracoccaceae bacterium]|nr:sensor histidine kinase N-terminal domain-containing protein [Paracoccaceae bacterium]
MAEPTAPRRTVSLTTRLAAAIALLLAAGGAGVAVAAFAYGHQAAEQAYDRLLIGAANQIAGAITIRDGAVAVDIPVSAFELLALAPEDRVVYAVFGPEGIITGYDDLAPPAPEDALYQGSFRGEPVRLAAVRRQFSERAFSGAVEVVVGQTTRARADLAAEITRSALIVAAAIGLLMVGLAFFAIRSALRPLRRIEQSLALREPRDLTPLDVAVPGEIESLVAAINRFMARLERQFSIMRSLIADASHQLRTPVAALRVQAELAAEEADPARQRAIVARIHERSVGLSRLTDQMLNHALIIHRADAAPRDRLDLRIVAIRTVEET